MPNLSLLPQHLTQSLAIITSRSYVYVLKSDTCANLFISSLYLFLSSLPLSLPSIFSLCPMFYLFFPFAYIDKERHVCGLLENEDPRGVGGKRIEVMKREEM